eukprot:scaffold11677_cov46-Phaeocystis_antarctica.AAC.2
MKRRTRPVYPPPHCACCRRNGTRQKFKVEIMTDIATSVMLGSPTGEWLIAVPLRYRCMRARRPNLAVPSASA